MFFDIHKSSRPIVVPARCAGGPVGAVAARLSASVAAVDATDENVLFKFSANKTHTQGQLKRMGKKEKKGRSESAEDARRIVL